jgi:hypothetical protein
MPAENQTAPWMRRGGEERMVDRLGRTIKQDDRRSAQKSQETSTPLFTAAETGDDLARDAAIHERMCNWHRDLEDRVAHAQLLLDLGAPDPSFDNLADELATFRYCVEALAFNPRAA